MGGLSTSWESPVSSYDWAAEDKVVKRKAVDYAKADEREYTGHSSKGLKAPVGKEISTDSDLVAIVMLDVTGSMDQTPRILLEKFATFYSESNALLQGYKLDDLKDSKKKVENKLEVAVLAIGDANGDDFPLQVVNFAKGPTLIKGVNEIFPEGGGGPALSESYELGAYYLLKHCNTPNVQYTPFKKPLLIIAGDEKFYNKVRKDYVKKMTGFTEIFGGLGALLGFLFSLGFSIQGQSGLNLISNMTLFTTNPSEYTKGIIILLAIVLVCGAVGALLGAFLDGSNRK